MSENKRGRKKSEKLVLEDTIKHKETVEELIKSEKFCRNTLDNMMEGCQIIGFDWRYLYVNDALARHGRRPKEELIERTMMEAYPGIEKTEMFKELRRCMKKRTTRRMENEFAFPDGSKGWFDLHIQPVPEGVFILSQDVTDRKLAEQRIENLNSLLSAIRNVNQSIVQEEDLTNVVRRSCESLVETRQYLGCTIALMDEDCDKIAPVARSGKRQFVKDWVVSAKGRVHAPNCVKTAFRSRKLHIVKDTNTRTCRTCTYGEEHKNGDHSAIVVPMKKDRQVIGLLYVSLSRERAVHEEEQRLLQETANDLTFARSKFMADEALRKSEAELNRAQSVAKIGSWFLDVPKNDLRWSDETYRMFGIPKGAPMTHDLFMERVHPHDREYVNRKWKAAMAGEPHDIEHRIVVNGKTCHVNVKAKITFDKSGRALSGIGTVQDITERKRAEEELTKYKNHLEELVKERTSELTIANRQLEDANKELESFSYSVSHDLRAPLRAIDGFSHVMLEDYSGTLDEEAKRILNVIRDNTNKMKQLIEDLLSFSRLARKKITKSKVDLDELAEDVFRMLQAATPERKVKLKIKQPPSAHCDRTMVRDVLANLLSNAVKFTRPREKAVIEIGGRAEPQENDYYVKDNGVGFDMRFVNKLFGTFQRLHGEKEFEGTGIGLATVQRIIHRHGGRVWAKGKVDKGSTFYFTLPKIGMEVEHEQNE